MIRRSGTTYPSEQVVLQIEFASSRAQLLDRPDNLKPASDVLNCRSQISDSSYLDCLGNNLSNNQSQLLSVQSQLRVGKLGAGSQLTSGPQWSPAKTTMLCSAMMVAVQYLSVRRSSSKEGSSVLCEVGGGRSDGESQKFRDLRSFFGLKIEAG